MQGNGIGRILPIGPSVLLGQSLSMKESALDFPSRGGLGSSQPIEKNRQSDERPRRQEEHNYTTQTVTTT